MIVLLLPLPVLDVNSKSKGETVFHGDVLQRSTLKMKFGSFLHIFEATVLEKRHWASDLEMDFYLCQCPLYSSEEEDTPAILPKCMDDLQV